MSSSSSVSHVSNDEKDLIWKAYRDRQTRRVPVVLGSNPRVVLLNPDWNPEGYTFEQADQDPQIHLQVALKHALYLRTVLNQYCDAPTGLPEVWDVDMYAYNVYEAAMFGALLDYLPGQVPDTKICLDDDRKMDIFEQDITKPLDNPYIKDRLGFWHEMEKICKTLKFEGRPVRLAPWALCGTDGPVTVAMNLRGSDFMEEMVMDEAYAQKLMRFIVDAAIHRRHAFESYWGDRIARSNGMADDSVAMISTAMYRDKVLPIHRAFYESVPNDRVRSIHLCGDATRHFPMIHQELGVTSFDTGFPVDHGVLREQLGEDVEINGGPEVGLIMTGSAEQVYERAKSILCSGVKRGGRFVMREGNNLPPNAPLENLAAMYQATQDHGGYDT